MAASEEVVEAEVVEDGNDDQEPEATVAALVPHLQSSEVAERKLLTPAASLDQIGDAFEQYQQLRSRILDPETDFQSIWNGGSFLKRSGWRKLSTAFSVDYEIVAEEIKDHPEYGYPLLARFKVRAVAPNGRHVDGWGACSVYERCCEPGCKNTSRKHTHCDGVNGYGQHEHAWTHFSKPAHDIPATAETRAKNRAAADLFGMGEVSAEEVEAAGGGAPPSQQQSRRQQPKKQTRSNDAGSMTDNQRSKLFALLGEWAVSTPLRKAIQKAAYKVDSASKLSELAAANWIGALEDDDRRQKMLDLGRQLLADKKPEEVVEQGWADDLDEASQAIEEAQTALAEPAAEGGES